MNSYKNINGFQYKKEDRINERFCDNSPIVFYELILPFAQLLENYYTKSNPLPPKGGSLLLKPDSPIEGSSSLWIIELPSGIEPSGICSLPLPAKAGSPTETECGALRLRT